MSSFDRLVLFFFFVPSSLQAWGAIQQSYSTMLSKSAAWLLFSHLLHGREIVDECIFGVYDLDKGGAWAVGHLNPPD